MKKVKWGTVIASVSGLLSTWGSGKAYGKMERASHAKIWRQFQAEGTARAKVLREILLGV